MIVSFPPLFGHELIAVYASIREKFTDLQSNGVCVVHSGRIFVGCIRLNRWRKSTLSLVPTFPSQQDCSISQRT